MSVIGLFVGRHGRDGTVVVIVGHCYLSQSSRTPAYVVHPRFRERFPLFSLQSLSSSGPRRAVVLLYVQAEPVRAAVLVAGRSGTACHVAKRTARRSGRRPHLVVTENSDLNACGRFGLLSPGVLTGRRCGCACVEFSARSAPA